MWDEGDVTEVVPSLDERIRAITSDAASRLGNLAKRESSRA